MNNYIWLGLVAAVVLVGGYMLVSDNSEKKMMEESMKMEQMKKDEAMKMEQDKMMREDAMMKAEVKSDVMVK